MMMLSECVALAKKHFSEGLQARKDAIKPSSVWNCLQKATQIPEIAHDTVPKEKVPRAFWEPGIEAGYRPPYRPWSYYFSSVLKVHNETINVWTHIVGFLMILLYFYHYHLLLDFRRNEAAWPLMSFMISTMLCTAASSVAHLLHSKSAYVHYVAFSFDYAGAGLYCFGCMTFSLYYSYDEYVLEYFGPYVMPTNALLGIISCFSCSYGKTKYSLHHVMKRKIWFIVPCSVHFLICVTPPLFRLLKNCTVNGLEITFVEPEAFLNHFRSYTVFLGAALFFCGHIPEVKMPGGFDNFGHSHQFWHVFLLLTIFSQFHTAYYDLMNRTIGPAAQAQMPSYSSVFYYLAIVCLADAVIIIYNSMLAKRVVEEERQEMYHDKQTNGKTD